MPLAGGNNGQNSYCTRCNGWCEQIHATWNILHNWGDMPGEERKKNEINPTPRNDTQYRWTKRNIICGTQWASCSIVKMSASRGKCVCMCVCVCVCVRERNAKHQQQHSSIFLPSLQSIYCLVFFSSFLEGFGLTCMWTFCQFTLFYTSKQEPQMQQLAPFVSETCWDKLLSINKQPSDGKVILRNTYNYMQLILQLQLSRYIESPQSTHIYPTIKLVKKLLFLLKDKQN